GCCNEIYEYPLRHIEVSARVTGLQNTNPFAKAGVMLRTSNRTSYTAPFDPSGADVILDVRPTGDVEFMARSSEGAETTYVSGAVAPNADHACTLNISRPGINMAPECIS